jgi:putative hydrolase of the HAD superfamily
MIRAVLFDAVGTLIQLREAVGETYARYGVEYGVEVSPGALQSAFTVVLRRMPPMTFPGHTDADLRAAERGWWRTVVHSTFAAAGVVEPWRDFEAGFARLFDHYAGAGAWCCTAGAAATLGALRRRDLRIGMVSNFDYRLPAILEALGLAPLLDVIVLPSDAGAAKPDRRIFDLALARLEIRADQAVYVGDDADDDIAGARAAGVRAIDVTTLPGLETLEAMITASP